MLLLQPLFTVNTVTVFPDHADRDQFYYLPSNVRISTDASGKPAFTLIKFARDVTDNPAFHEGQALGGGFCAFSVDLGLDDDTRSEVTSRCRRFGASNPRLATAPFHSGTVKLIGLDANQTPEDGQVRFVERVEGTATPSLFGDLRATFSVRLSQEGATMLERSFEAGGKPLGVVYDVKFMALRPAFDVTVHAEYSKIYNEFKVTAGAQYLLLRAQVEAGFRRMEQDRALEVTVNTFDTDAQTVAAKEAALTFLKDQIIKDMFTPSLPLPAETSNNILSGLSNLLQIPQAGGRPLGQPPAAPAAPAVASAVTQAARAPAAPPPHPPTEATEQTSAASIATAGAQNPALHTAAPQSAPATPLAGLAAGAAGSGAGGAAGGAAPPAAAGGGGNDLAIGLNLRFMHDEELKTLDARWKEASAVERMHSPNGTFGALLRGMKKAEHVQEINLDDPFFQRIRVVAECPTPFATLGLSEVKVHLEYGDRGDGQPQFVGDLELKPDANGVVQPQIFTTGLDPARSLNYRYRIDYFFAPDSPWRGQTTHYSSPMIDATGPSGSIVVQPSDHIGFLPLSVEAVDIDFEQITSVQVTLGVQEAAGGFSVSDTLVLTKATPKASWQLRLGDPKRRPFDCDTVYVLKDGQRITMPRRQATVDTLGAADTLVINPPWNGQRQLLVDAGAALGPDVPRIMLEITYEDPGSHYRFSDVRRITKPEESFFSLTVPQVNPDHRTLLYRVTGIDRSNRVHQGAFTETQDAVLLVTAPT